MPVRDALQKIQYLPTIPITAQEVLKLTGDEMASVVTLGEIIAQDVSISAKILNVANSAYFGIRAGVKTVHDAILRIGFLNVKNIAFSLSLMSIFNDEKGKKIMDYERIFEHSSAVGMVAKLLSKELHVGISEEIIVNGLLHDIGFLTLCHYFMEQYDGVMYDFHRYDSKSLLDAELHILGFTHADVGSLLTEKWELDTTITNTIKYHHAPSQAPSDADSAALVHLADYITSDALLSVTQKNPGYKLDRASLEILQLSENDLSNLTDAMKQNVIYEARP